MNDNLDGRGRPRVQTTDFGKSLTVQSDADQANIQKILEKYEAVGLIDHLVDVELQYGDISELTDYADAMRQVSEAEGKFMTLPSKVREVFKHDVAIWLDAANDGLSDIQRAQLKKLGVLEAREMPAAPMEPVPEAPPAE